MQKSRLSAALIIAGISLVALIALNMHQDDAKKSIDSTPENRWSVSEEGYLQYFAAIPKYNLSFLSNDSISTLYNIDFLSSNEHIKCLLRIPKTMDDGICGIVLLPGASINKEHEQGLASYLAEIGYATITLDQRNLGVINVNGDLDMFIRGEEPIEHKMVYDSLLAAEVLRAQPEIDPEKIIYMGESNGGRTAIIATALDKRSKGVLAISTCGYGTDSAIFNSRLTDQNEIKFYRSIDPETYMDRISPRTLVMINSINDTIIPYQYAQRTFSRGSEPKIFHSIGCRTHGFCQEMKDFLEKDLRAISST